MPEYAGSIYNDMCERVLLMTDFCVLLSGSRGTG